MGTVLKVKLSAESLAKAAAEVERYRKSLEKKCSIFRRKLIEKGIEVAQVNGGEYAGCISFTFESGDGNVSYLVARDARKIHREWRYKGGMRGYDVSPLLLAEFGSGWLSEVLFDVAGVGQGTMPGQKHAFEESWSWVDTNPDGGTPLKNGWYAHRSKGEAPTHPMYQAEMAMLREIGSVAREVFQTNEVIQC